MRDVSHPIPAWNLDLLKERYPTRRPPLLRETVDAWGVILPPQLYEYLTEFSDTLYRYKSGMPALPIKLSSTSVVCLDDDIYDTITLDLSSGSVFRKIWHKCVDDEDDVPEEGNTVRSSTYQVAASFEEFIMEPFRAPPPKCECQLCFLKYAKNYNILRIMSGTHGLSY